MSVEIVNGDCRDVLPTLASESVNCIVTSPPYFGLRDYGHKGQMGLEPTPTEFVEALVGVLREARRVLRDDGTLWLNLGDSYSSGNGQKTNGPQTNITSVGGVPVRMARGATPSDDRASLTRSFAGMPKNKDLIGIPWRVAFALQADGWYLRQDIIWHKPNPMPESVTDRCTKAHEYIFLLSKSERYYFDADAIREPHTRIWDASKNGGSLCGTDGRDKAVIGGHGRAERKHSEPNPLGRNRRSVWTVSTKPFKGAHFATFPPALIEPCILAGCPVGGTVLDPFGGAGTTGMVANQHGRNAVLIELNPEYAGMAKGRIQDAHGMFAEVT